MEEKEIQRITENLSNLVLNTNCSKMLLAKMEQAGVFHREDVEIICNQPTSVAKSSMFYDIIKTRCGAFPILMHGLEETNQSGALQVLKVGGGLSTSSSAAAAIIGVSINVVAPLPTFTGRKAELNKMHDQLTQDLPESLNSRRIITITGLGGVGKTQMCRRYVQLHATYYNKNVIWLNAESKDNLSRDFLDLAQQTLKLKSAEQNKADVGDLVVEHVYNYFRNRRCLFVFDNIEKGDHLKTYLPLSTGFADDWNNIHFILTSRVAVWEKQYNAIKLNVLDVSDATDMVRNIIGDEGDDDDKDSCLCLVNEMQSLPLALHQACAFIREEQVKGSSFGIRDYLAEYRSKKELCLSFADSEGCTQGFDYTKQTVLTTWQITIDRIRQYGSCGELAIQVLECVAYLRPDKIRTGILTPLFTNSDSLKEGIALLIRYSLVNIMQNGQQQHQDVWSVHRLVLEVMRLRLQQANREERVLRRLLHKLGGVHRRKHVDSITNIFVHALAYECLMSDFEDLQRDVSSELILKAKVTTSLNIMCTLGHAQGSTLGQIESSHQHRKGASWITKFFRLTALLSGKFSQMNLSNVLGNALDKDDDYWLLVIRSKSACTIRAVEDKLKYKGRGSKVSGVLDPDVLLMFLYLQNGDVLKSIEYYKNVLVGNILGDKKSNDIFRILSIVITRSVLHHIPANSLVKCLAYSSKYWLTTALLHILTDKELGTLRKGKLEMFGSLCTVLSVLGHHENAIQFLSYAYRIHENVCHLDSLHSLLRLADALRRKGDLGESRELYEFAHRKALQECGEDSEFIFEATLGLSELLSEEKKYEEALTLLQKLQEDMSRRFGLTEEYYVQMVNVLRGKALRNLGRYEESLTLLRSIPERFGDRIGWQFLPSQSLAKEIQSVERSLKRQKLLEGVRTFFVGNDMKCLR